MKSKLMFLSNLALYLTYTPVSGKNSCRKSHFVGIPGGIFRVWNFLKNNKYCWWFILYSGAYTVFSSKLCLLHFYDTAMADSEGGCQGRVFYRAGLCTKIKMCKQKNKTTLLVAKVTPDSFQWTPPDWDCMQPLKKMTEVSYNTELIYVIFWLLNTGNFVINMNANCYLM